MKAQRRQELKHNTLADQLAEMVEYIQNRSQVIILVVVAIVVLLGAGWYWRYSARASRVEGWQTMLILLSTSKQQDSQVLEKLEQMAGSYSDVRLKAMAYAQLGNRLIDEAKGIDKPEAAQDYRRRAEAAFQAVLNQTPGEVVPAAIAQLGLASIAADKGEFEAAKRYYEAVGNSDPLKGTPYPAQAAAGLTALETAKKLPALATASQPAEAAGSASQPANG